MAGHSIHVICWLGTLFLCANTCSARNIDIPSWVQSALRAQTLLSADTDISKLALCGANGVFNTLAFSPNKWKEARPYFSTGTGLACVVQRCLIGVADIHSQDLSVTQLLDIGVRRLGLSLHHVPGIGGDPFRLCRGDDHFHRGCNNLKLEVKFDACSSLLEVPTLSETSTGCTVQSSSISAGLTAIDEWIHDTSNLEYDIIILDLSDFISLTVNESDTLQASARAHIITAIESSALAKHVLTVAELASFRSGAGVSATAWPTPKQLVDVYEKRVVMIVGDGVDSVLSNKYVHNVAAGSTLNNMQNSANNFPSASCPSTVSAFQPYYESRKILLLNETESGVFRRVVSNEHGPEEFGVIDGATARRIAECGASPSLDRVNVSTITSSCIWTYAEGSSPPGRGGEVVFNVNTGWTVSNVSAQQLRKACRNSDGTVWTLSQAGQSCPATFTFAIPSSPPQAAALRLALTQASVASALLPSDVEGVTETEDVRGKSSKKAVGIAVGVSVAVVAVACVIVLSILYTRRAATTASGDEKAVVVNSDTL